MRGIVLAGLGALILCTLAAVALPASAASTYLLIEHPDRLTLLNKYQQELSPGEKALLVPFVAMRIMKQDDVLSDGYTHCTQVEIGGSTFFVVKDGAGRFIADGSPGSQHTVTGATTLGDTIAIIQEHRVEFRPQSGRPLRLDAGATLIRIFRGSQGTYCRLDGTPSVYGWITMEGLRQNADWTKVELQHKEPSISLSDTERKVRASVSEINGLLVRLFRFFDARTGESKTPPAWRVEAGASSITCLLEGTPDPAHYRQSTFYLVNTIETIARSSSLRVLSSPGRIEIQAAE
jgi:hypothetical protein